MHTRRLLMPHLGRDIIRQNPGRGHGCSPDVPVLSKRCRRLLRVDPVKVQVPPSPAGQSSKAFIATGSITWREAASGTYTPWTTKVGKECLRTIAAAPTSEQRTIYGRNDRAARGPARHNWANSGRSERLSKRWLVGNGTRPGQSHVIVEACNVMQIASPGRASPAIRRTP
jgi:hypothetical protein